MLRIVIIGNGAVAEGLAYEVAGASGVELVQQWARSERGGRIAESLGVPWSNRELLPADLYILAISDTAVPEVSATMPFPSGSVVAHTAGCVAMGELSPKIAHRAVLYPLQTFTRGRCIEDFRRTPFFIEGETPHALATVRAAAEALSDSVTEMSSPRRARLHLAGAFANNFSNAMLSIAEILAADAGETFDALRPIVSETLAKALDMPSPRLAQTGAAQRGDRTIRGKHLEILAADHPELIPIYEETSELIWKISKKN